MCWRATKLNGSGSNCGGNGWTMIRVGILFSIWKIVCPFPLRMQPDLLCSSSTFPPLKVHAAAVSCVCRLKWLFSTDKFSTLVSRFSWTSHYVLPHTKALGAGLPPQIQVLTQGHLKLFCVYPDVCESPHTHHPSHWKFHSAASNGKTCLLTQYHFPTG